MANEGRPECLNESCDGYLHREFLTGLKQSTAQMMRLGGLAHDAIISSEKGRVLRTSCAVGVLPSSVTGMSTRAISIENVLIDMKSECPVTTATTATIRCRQP